MAPQWTALIRDAVDEGAELFAGRALLVAAPAVLAAAAGVFLAVAGYSALYDAFGPRVAALSFAALFAMLSAITYLVARTRAVRRKRRADAARAQIAAEIAALRSMTALQTIIGRGTVLAPFAAAVAAFAMARR